MSDNSWVHQPPPKEKSVKVIEEEYETVYEQDKRVFAPFIGSGDTVAERIEQLTYRLSLMWYAEGAPGYKKAKRSFSVAQTDMERMRNDDETLLDNFSGQLADLYFHKGSPGYEKKGDELHDRCQHRNIPTAAQMLHALVLRRLDTIKDKMMVQQEVDDLKRLITMFFYATGC